ncbi:MAG: DHHA1 domain-containing protein, partial [Patescibacteria group bacterium]|nr:DHHA1 domain-containing protein [Patescibacteria group bacterium]
LFLGIVTDTGCLQFSNTSATTLRVVADLIDKGACLNEVVLKHYRSYQFKTIKYWGKIMENMQLDESGKFVWSKLSREELSELGVEPTDMEGAGLFAPIIFGTEFGIIIHDEGNQIRVSLRSRNLFDVSKIALAFGGGGHKQAAGFSLKLPLDQAEKIVLEKAREMLNQN